MTFSLDVAKNAFVGLLTNQDQTITKLVKWTHPQDSHAFIGHLHKDLGMARLDVAMEPTGTYGGAMRWQFVKRGITVYQVSPKHVHDQAETFDGVPTMMQKPLALLQTYTFVVTLNSGAPPLNNVIYGD